MLLPQRELKLSNWGYVYPHNSPNSRFLTHSNVPGVEVDITDLGEIEVVDVRQVTEPKRRLPRGCQRTERKGLIIVYRLSSFCSH